MNNVQIIIIILGILSTLFYLYRNLTTLRSGVRNAKLKVFGIAMAILGASGLLFYLTLPSCPNNCSGNGTCDAINGVCTCNSGFSGVDCSIKSCPNDCSNHGRCVNGSCICNPPYSGADCSKIDCPPGCEAHGTCDTSSGICKCNSGYFLKDCSKYCDAAKTCNNNGTCDPVTGKCLCVNNYKGENCEISPGLSGGTKLGLIFGGIGFVIIVIIALLFYFVPNWFYLLKYNFGYIDNVSQRITELENYTGDLRDELRKTDDEKAKAKIQKKIDANIKKLSSEYDTSLNAIQKKLEKLDNKYHSEKEQNKKDIMNEYNELTNTYENLKLKEQSFRDNNGKKAKSRKTFVEKKP
jgi:hypothetical protein